MPDPHPEGLSEALVAFRHALNRTLSAIVAENNRTVPDFDRPANAASAMLTAWVKLDDLLAEVVVEQQAARTLAALRAWLEEQRDDPKFATNPPRMLAASYMLSELDRLDAQEQ